MTKEAAQKVFNDLPEEFELDDLLEKLVFIAKVEKGRQQVKEGKGISHDDMVKKIRSWSK